MLLNVDNVQYVGINLDGNVPLFTFIPPPHKWFEVAVRGGLHQNQCYMYVGETRPRVQETLFRDGHTVRMFSILSTS